MSFNNYVDQMKMRLVLYKAINLIALFSAKAIESVEMTPCRGDEKTFRVHSITTWIGSQ